MFKKNVFFKVAFTDMGAFMSIWFSACTDIIAACPREPLCALASCSLCISQYGNICVPESAEALLNVTVQAVN